MSVRAHSPSRAADDTKARLAAVMAAIAAAQLTLGELLVGVFTPDVFSAPAHAQLVRAFLRGEQPVRMAHVLDRLLAHPDARGAADFARGVPYGRLLHARAVLTAWAAQACAGAAQHRSAAAARRTALPAPPPTRLLPVVPVPESPTASAAGTVTATVGAPSAPVAGPSAPRGTLLTVDLISEARTVSVVVSSPHPLDRGASASIWQGTMLGDAPRTVALKVFRPTTSPQASQEIVDREIQAWRRLHHARLLQLLGTSTWESQTVLVSPYLSNGNMLQYLQANRDVDPLGLVIQVAEGLRYLHNEARVVHGDLKCQNVLITDHGDAVLADFGLSTLIDKLESESHTASEIRWQGTLRFCAPELLGALSDDDRGQMRSKTVKTDIYAFGMLALQAFTGASPWGGISEMKVIEYILSGLNPPNPGATARGRGLDDSLWLICLWCWQFKSLHRPPIDLIYHALAVQHLKDSGASPAGMVGWLESREFEQQNWNWPVLNGLLAILRSPTVSDALTNESMAGLLRAIVHLDPLDIAELRAALKHFVRLLRLNDHCSLRLLSVPPDGCTLWTSLHSVAYAHSPGEVLDVACIVGAVLLRLSNGLDSSMQGRIKAAEQWEFVNAAISVFLERTVDDLLTSMPVVDDPDLLSRCDRCLQRLMYLTAQLSPAVWRGIRAALVASIKELPAHRGSEYFRHLARLGTTPRKVNPVPDVFDSIPEGFVFDPE